ncbi:MAG TPA: PLP-dependent aminotransferase family protein [Steroidobacteraceae bacterium]
MFELSRESPVPLVDQIVERLTKLIRDGQLPSGSRVPSIRKLAKMIGASAFTVADAYDRLVARGVIESRAGRGFFVTRQRTANALAVVEALPQFSTDALALANASFSQPTRFIAAGSGFLPASWLMEAVCSSVIARMARGRRPDAWLPCPPQGLPELREQLSAQLVSRGIPAGPQNILTTFGASQAFDLIARLLFTPGDVVLVEEPGYFVMFEQLRAHHVRLVPIPRHANGPDLEVLESECRAQRPRAFFVQSVLHNPTGSTAEPAICHRLLSLAEQYGFAVIEDDVYGELYEGPAVRLAQIDGLRHVIYVSSFTKLIGPALRVGYIAADVRLIGQLVERKVLSVLSGSSLAECVVSEVLDSGRFRRHVEMVRARLAHMRREARTALEKAGVSFETGGDGIFLWGHVPEHVDVDALVRKAREQSILLAKGALFSPTGRCNQWLRFNAAHSTAPELVRFLDSAIRAVA